MLPCLQVIVYFFISVIRITQDGLRGVKGRSRFPSIVALAIMITPSKEPVHEALDSVVYRLGSECNFCCVLVIFPYIHSPHFGHCYKKILILHCFYNLLQICRKTIFRKVFKCIFNIITWERSVKVTINLQIMMYCNKIALILLYCANLFMFA